MAMMCRARLSWRSPPRCRRWRWRAPEEAGIGAVPVWRANWASVAKRSAPAVRPIRAAGVSAPQPVSCSSRGRLRADEGAQFVLQRVGVAGELTDAGDEFARDAHAGAGGAATQPARDAVQLRGPVQRALGQGGLEVGAEVDEVPAQAVLRAGALGDEIVAVIGQQPDVHGALIQKRGWEALDSVAQHGAGDGQRVDLIRLAGLAFAAARGAHEPGR